MAHPNAFDTIEAPSYISDMRLIACLALLILPVLFGCSSPAVPPPRTAEENLLFGPVSMKLDTFSKVKDWDANGIPDGIEALIEFDDRFGDRTKAAGVIMFELYDYRPYWPDPRGPRLANPWTASLATYDEQKAHWETASGAYTFRLAFDKALWNHSYVLTAMYQSAAGTRLFSRIVLRPQKPENREPTTTSSNAG
ncbi:MAG: hypothetical protein ABSC42_10980 [Tepidisphaeraceae bacterium]